MDIFQRTKSSDKEFKIDSEEDIYLKYYIGLLDRPSSLLITNGHLWDTRVRDPHWRAPQYNDYEWADLAFKYITENLVDDIVVKIGGYEVPMMSDDFVDSDTYPHPINPIFHDGIYKEGRAEIALGDNGWGPMSLQLNNPEHFPHDIRYWGDVKTFPKRVTFLRQPAPGDVPLPANGGTAEDMFLSVKGRIDMLLRNCFKD